ncbi:3-dehydroquinate dehydratase II [invertebrate metagenome]|uniref:3-dehydroquinate dehydratase n=1 Tax=invertebrate metagenome TaxID=1711999 RepID=A0A484H7X8_9ZZZZ
MNSPISSLVFILNGPNLNMLGKRQTTIYGRATLADIEAVCHRHAATLDLGVDFRQSNHEGELVSWIQEAGTKAVGIIVNAGAYTHTSVAILDALLIVTQPIIEIHLSNIQAREVFRHHSYIAPVAVGCIAGFGVHGYQLALTAMADLLARDAPSAAMQVAGVAVTSRPV